jgi:hypothetical protein
VAAVVAAAVQLVCIRVQTEVPVEVVQEEVPVERAARDSTVEQVSLRVPTTTVVVAEVPVLWVLLQPTTTVVAAAQEPRLPFQVHR